MYFDMAGADFFRLQRANAGRVGDPLDADVLFSGAYEDGQALFFQREVDAPGTANAKSYDIRYGRTFERPPMVMGALKLTQNLFHNNTMYFTAGEYLAPCAYRRNVYGVGPVVNYNFSWVALTDRVQVSITGFSGVVSLMCLEIA